MSNTSPYITFGAPAIGDDEIAEVEACLRSGWLGTGPRVARFEEEFARYKGLAGTQVAAVNSCTAALHVSMIAAKLEPGSEVITTPLTFCATINAIIHAGLTPVLADVDPHTQNIDPDAIEAAITPRTSAILPVHFAGRPCEMDRIMAIANKHDLVVIEDCAHAIETEFHGQKAGTFGDFGCFSFYVTKNLVTGEGGMIIGRREEDIARAKILALHGLSKDAWHRFSDSGYKHYEVTECGFKYNMMDLQAALGIHQLKQLGANWQRRESIWHQYRDAFQDLPATLPAQPNNDTRHAYHLFTILLDQKVSGTCRDDAIGQLQSRGIGSGVHYRSVAMHPYYQKRFDWQAEDCPHALQIGESTLSLPLSAGLSTRDTKHVIQAVRSVIAN